MTNNPEDSPQTTSNKEKISQKIKSNLEAMKSKKEQADNHYQLIDIDYVELLTDAVLEAYKDEDISSPEMNKGLATVIRLTTNLLIGVNVKTDPTMFPEYYPDFDSSSFSKVAEQMINSGSARIKIPNSNDSIRDTFWNFSEEIRLQPEVQIKDQTD